jgi:hypothetical protein
MDSFCKLSEGNSRVKAACPSGYGMSVAPAPRRLRGFASNSKIDVPSCMGTSKLVALPSLLDRFLSERYSALRIRSPLVFGYLEDSL